MSFVAVLALAGCRNPVSKLELAEVAEHPAAALLSVSGTSPDDVWIVGARPGPTAEGTLLRNVQGSWESVSTGVPHDL
ncbi:MAG: hypothetical protein KC656_36190, partial [Myxococcales bacterium]|nr:hypothetical protein [Myxococcales bacterium]